MKRTLYIFLLFGIVLITACQPVQPPNSEIEPPHVTVETTTTTDTVTWTWNNVPNAAGYRYALQSESNWTEVSSDTTSYTYTGLIPGEYDVTLYVQTKNSAGKYSTSGSAKTHVAYCGLPAPTVTGTSPVAGTSVTWTWTAVPGAVQYRCSTESAMGPWFETSNTSYTKDNIAPGQYTLWVQAKASNGLWSASGSKTITLLPPGTSTTTIRIMEANLSSGNNQSYTDGPGIRIMTGCHPDVVLVQEFNYKTNSAADLQEMANLVIYGTVTHNPNAYYYRGTGSIPNGIISKYPFVSSGEWDDTYMTDREFAWARIDVPGSIDLWAVSIHLKASSDSESKTKRTNEATLLQSYITTNVPAGLYLAVGGDFNTYSNSTSTEPCMVVFGQFTVFPDPNGHYPADINGNINTNSNRSSPYDRVLVNSALSALEIPVVIGSNTFTWGFVADTRVYNPIADLYPALSTDSGATNMQHMGVVRDFSIGN